MIECGKKYRPDMDIRCTLPEGHEPAQHEDAQYDAPATMVWDEPMPPPPGPEHPWNASFWESPEEEQFGGSSHREIYYPDDEDDIIWDDEEPDREPSAEMERNWDEMYDGTSLGR